MNREKMFGKFRTSAVAQEVLSNNPIIQYFEMERQTGTAGPEHLWRIYDSRRRSDGKEASIFVFEKKLAEKIHKPKRKVAVTDKLRKSVKHLERCQHITFLKVLHSVEECNDTLAYATEPVFCSLSNVYATKAESKNTNESIPAEKDADSSAANNVNEAVPNMGRYPYDFLDVEYKHGILQIAEALMHLHYTCHLIHRNVCPECILISKKGTWKLFGLEFSEYTSDAENCELIDCQPWSSRLFKMAQPNLDFIAPEIQTTAKCSILSDMFSLGMVIVAIFNSGKSLIDAGYSASNYLKQLEQLPDKLKTVMGKIPFELQEVVQRLLQRDYRQRVTTRLFLMEDYFCDAVVSSLQYLDIISRRDVEQKTNFYSHMLMDVLPVIPKRLWFRQVFPFLQEELKMQHVSGAVLIPIFYMMEEGSPGDFKTHIIPALKSLLTVHASVQATIVLLENLHRIIKADQHDNLKEHCLNFLYLNLNKGPVNVQKAALVAISNLPEHLEESAVKSIIVPNVKMIYEAYFNDISVVLHLLPALESILGKLERSVIIDDILPIIWDIKLQDAEVISRIVDIYRLMLTDKKYGLTVNLMATKAMPLLIPQTVNPLLNLEQFTNLLVILSDMMDHIDRQQRNQLKLDHIKAPLGEYRGVFRCQHGSDHLMSKHLNIPAFPARKTSSAEEVYKYLSSHSVHSSPDSSNFLRVQAAFCSRRLSDNALAPQIRIINSAASSPGDTMYSSSGLPMRRHSSFGASSRGLVKRGSLAGSLTPTFFPFGGRSAPGSTTSLLSPSSRRSSLLKNQRSSAMFSLGQGSFLQQLGSGMVGAVKYATPTS